jgi:hypothetical protein
MPSGMMTMSDVPTSTPVPRSVMMRSWRGERVKDSGRTPATNELMAVSLRSMWYHYITARDAYAIAIIVLKVSSMNRPSHMLRVVCGGPLESLKKEEYAGYARRKAQRCTSLSAAHASVLEL